MSSSADKKAWNEAKKEAKVAISERAKVRGMISYSDLVAQIETITFKPHDVRLFRMLGEISSEEFAEGRGLMTAIVVHKVGDMQPGQGFFELAEDHGLDTSDILACWVSEFKKVHAAWSLS